jgi:hypothetical protein
MELLAARWPELEREGIGPDPDSILDAAAVGMVERVWRNSPLEDMHAGKRGPSDGEVFAESVALQGVARAALIQGGSSGLLAFEGHVLDRERPWAAGGRTLQDMGYGHLGAFTRHVKQQIDVLMDIDEGLREATSSWLLDHDYGHLRKAASRHGGMPGWPGIVAGVRAVLENPEHPAWNGHGRESITAAPAETPPPDQLCRILIDAPDKLPLSVFDWLTHKGVMMAAESSTLAMDTSTRPEE